MSSNGACLYEDGGIEGGHIPSYLFFTYVYDSFIHVYSGELAVTVFGAGV